MPVVKLPAALSYPGSEYIAYGPKNCPPNDGNMVAPFYLNWSLVTLDRPGFNIEFRNKPQMPKQIACLWIDNARCHQGITIIFPDTGFRLVIKPFKRGYYPVVTAGCEFSVFIPVVQDAAFDQTTIFAMNYNMPPSENDVQIYQSSVVSTFDPASAQAAVVIATSTDGFFRLRSLELTAGNMTAGGAGFDATFNLNRDGNLYKSTEIVLGPGGYVDTATLFQLVNEGESAARTWTFDWTINAGALTGPGFAVLNTLLDNMDFI